MLIEDQPCTKQCSLIEHGEIISAALTKRGVSDAELCAFLNYVCDLCGSSKDIGGRTALQIAASCGRTEVCKWLICQKQAKIDERDNESGYTALHRSIFYGKIDTAVALLKLGANPNILDYNDLTPLEHAMMDNLLPPKPLIQRLIYMWGSNSNYTLGTQSRTNPEIMDAFQKTNPTTYVKQIYLEKFHTMILTENGNVFAYGIGQGGRLGLGSEQTILEPSQVRFPGDVIIQQVSVARDHCLFLSVTKEVWVCGSNAHMVLGMQPPPAKLLSPRPINKFKKNISGICCGRYHSVAWGPNCLYTWGLHAGHLGHDRSEQMHITTPKLVTSVIGDWSIKSVEASYGATVIATDRGDVYVLHEFYCRKIASRHLDIEVVKVIGGRLSFDKLENADLKVIALTRTRDILIWQESDPQLSRGIFSLNRLFKIKDVALNVNGMVLLTEHRELYKAKLVKRKKQQEKVGKAKGNSFHKFLDRSDCIMINLEKIPRIHGADTICSDLEGENFASLHMNTSAYLTKIPNISQSTMEADFRELITNPVLSDHTFNIKENFFAVHKYIIGRASPKLKKMMLDGDETIIDSIHPEIFSQILKYIYTNHCDLLQLGPCLIKISKTISSSEVIEEEHCDNISAFEAYNKKKKIVSKNVEVNDVLRFLQEAAKFLGMTDLQKVASTYFCTNGVIKSRENKTFLPNILQYENNLLNEFCDIVIESKNGQVIEAHRCILAARSEFFGNMFSVRWGEVPKHKLSLPFPQNSLMHLMNYLYTDQVNLDKQDLEAVCNLLILAEYILLNRLSEICQFTLCKMLTFKNAFRLLSLSHIYNAAQLKVCCMEYICLNLAAGLEVRYFEQLEEEILIELTKFYSEWNKKMCTRVITPFSDAVNDDIIAEISKTHPIKMDFQEVIKIIPKTNQRKRNRSHKISFSDKNDTKVIESEKLNEKIEIEVVSEKVVPTRIHAITSALEKISVYEYENNFVTLTKGDFPDLSSSFGSPDGHRFGFKSEKIDKHKMTRISQKTRKRLSSEGSNKEILSESPKNPWKIIEPVSPIGSPEVKVNMSSIITEEKKQKENLVKLKSKLLLYTQMEDRAIEELKKFYNVDNVFDELIVAERVEVGAVATPVWVQK